MGSVRVPKPTATSSTVTSSPFKPRSLSSKPPLELFRQLPLDLILLALLLLTPPPTKNPTRRNRQAKRKRRRSNSRPSLTRTRNGVPTTKSRTYLTSRHLSRSTALSYLWTTHPVEL